MAFTPRPAQILAKLTEKMKKTKLQAYAGPGDVECDICTGKKHIAVKSCLVCLESYCEIHIDRHEEFRSGKPHKVTDITGRLQELICPQHDKLLEVFCCTDQKCICMLCTMDEHKNHDTISAAAQRKTKEKLLKETQRKFQQRIWERKKVLQELREAVESHKRTAQTAVKENEKVFNELIRSIQRNCSEVTQLIRDQEMAAVTQAEEHLEQLEQEIADLRKRDAELEQLLQTEDHIHFLQSLSIQSLSAPPKSTDRITVSFPSSFDDVRESVWQLRQKLEKFCKEEIADVFLGATYSGPKIRKEFLQYFRHLTLNPNTAYKHLCLSNRNKVAAYTDGVQLYPDHPDRFDYHYQVLCRESVCGCCYWEAEWSGRDGVSISVSYKSISRKGWDFQCKFGHNDQSWSLFCSPSKCSFYHNNDSTNLPVESISSRIGVYVDHSAGTLSFYSVSDTMTLVHRVQTTFTQPLCPGFECRSGSKVKLI